MRFRWVLRLLGWNVLLLSAGVVLIAIAGEAYLRLSMPFMVSDSVWKFVPNVGRLRPPNTEIRSTNGVDYWNISRTNSLGFLDREPPRPELAAATCHISMIGDSLVDAWEVPVHDKFHVRLEELAADELPHLNVTTSAFGIRNTGQVQQLPLYDEYARLLRPKLLVLVFVHNDFMDNVPILRLLRVGGRRESTVHRRSDGRLELAWEDTRGRFPFLQSPPPQISWVDHAMKEVGERSHLFHWLRKKQMALFPTKRSSFLMRAESLRGQLVHVELFEGWRPNTRKNVIGVFGLRNLPPFFKDALEYTAFALGQFRQRANRDGAELVVLASHTLKPYGELNFERLSQIAASLDIPVIDQADYILRQGSRLTDAGWKHDFHWSPDGHRWAAEALLEYIKEHPAICDGPT